MGRPSRTCASVERSQPGSDAAVTLQRASTLLDLGRPQEALQALAEAGDDGRSGHAHCLRTLAYLRLERLDEAERSAGAARAASPAAEWGYRLGAIAALRKGRLKEAVRLAAEAVGRAPDEPFTHQVATIALLNSRNLLEARVHSAEMLRLAPGLALSHQTHGRVLVAQGRLPEAESSLRQALALDPQSADSMSLLADVSTRLGRRDEANALRLSAVRADPQNIHRQRDLLKRGGAVAAGGVLFKLAFFGGLFHGAGLLSGAPGMVLLILPVLLVAFLFSRIRRHRRGSSLPPLVWEGLRPARRNQDLLWVARPSALLLIASVVATVEAATGGGNVTAALGLAAGCVALLAVCWRLRQGEARQLTFGASLRRAGRIGRLLWERHRPRLGISGIRPNGIGPKGMRATNGDRTGWVRASDPTPDDRWRRHRPRLGISGIRPNGIVPKGMRANGMRATNGDRTGWVRASDPTPDDRWRRTVAFAFVELMIGTVFLNDAGSWAAAAVTLIAAGVLGALFDGRDRTVRGVGARVVALGTTLRAGRARLAVRAVLRLLLLPLLVLEILGRASKPHRFLHDKLTGTEYIGLLPDATARQTTLSARP